MAARLTRRLNNWLAVEMFARMVGFSVRAIYFVAALSMQHTYTHTYVHTLNTQLHSNGVYVKYIHALA